LIPFSKPLFMKSYFTFGALLWVFCAQAQTAIPTPAPTTAQPANTAAPAEIVTAAPTEAYPTGPLKIGYTNVQYLLAASPQIKVIKSQLESASKQYERVIKEKSDELEEKFANYQKNEATMMESIKADKQNELRTLETSIRTLQENASTELKTKENELVKPELEKIYAAIEDVAKANGYTYVLNSDQVVLYADKGTEMTNLVLKKLGYPEPKEEDAKAEAKTSSSGGGQSPAKPKPATAGKPGAAPSPSGKKGK
jgi:outer membrane protein